MTVSIDFGYKATPSPIFAPVMAPLGVLLVSASPKNDNRYIRVGRKGQTSPASTDKFVTFGPGNQIRVIALGEINPDLQLLVADSEDFVQIGND